MTFQTGVVPGPALPGPAADLEAGGEREAEERAPATATMTEQDGEVIIHLQTCTLRITTEQN